MKDISKLSAVSESLFIPLYCRAMETKSKNPVIFDTKAVEIIQGLKEMFDRSGSKLGMALSEHRLPKKLTITMSLRTRKFDEYVRDFISKHENPVVVNMGCGLDTRFVRLNPEKADWYDLDFPEVIDVRELYFEQSDNYHFIRSSVLDYSWMNVLAEKKNSNFLFLAEGLFMYLNEEDVRTLIIKLQSNFPGCELVCEVTNRYWVRKMQGRYYRRKFEKRLYLSGDAIFKSGIAKSEEFEGWSKGIQFLDDWTYFDDNEKKLGWYNLFKGFELLRKVQWVVHYKLN